MPQTSIRVASELLEALELHRPKWKTLPRFVEDQLEKVVSELAAEVTLGSQAQPGDPSSSNSSSSSPSSTSSSARALTAEKKPAKQKDIYASKNLSPELVPGDLQQHAVLLVDYWSVKKGTRSERAWNDLTKKLRAWTPENQEKALTAAYNAQWATVYEPTDTPKQGKWKEQTFGIVPTPPLSPAMQEWIKS